jgi:hypothetical protein
MKEGKKGEGVKDREEEEGRGKEWKEKLIIIPSRQKWSTVTSLQRVCPSARIHTCT